MKLFSHTERRGLVFLAPLMAIVILLAAVYEICDVQMLGDNEQRTSASAAVTDMDKIKPFNPNCDSYEQLREAGLSQEVAVGIVRWRKYGKVYRIVEDLALVAGVNDSIYAALKPFVIIDDSLSVERIAVQSKSKFQQQPKPDKRVEVRPTVKTQVTDRSTRKMETEKFAIDTASAEYLAGWGLSLKQAEVLVRYRDASGGIFSEEHLRRCYVVDGEVADSLARYMVYSVKKSDGVGSVAVSHNREVQTTVEINSADSATLVAIDGIGPMSAAEIVKYRKYLGGYYSVEQIAELKCIREQNFVKFLPKISCDSCKISKIDINFAGPKELERHPYVSAQALRRIVKQRQLKGGWTRIEEMIEQNILSEKEAKRLAPYLRFGPRATE